MSSARLSAEGVSSLLILSSLTGIASNASFDLNDVSKSKITLHIPAGCSFKDVEAEIGAGVLEMSGFQADKMECFMENIEIFFEQIDFLILKY